MRAEETHRLSAAGPSRRTLGLEPTQLAAALAVVAWLAFAIGLHPLTLPDEGRYVGVAWEMMRSGDWLVPMQNGLPFFHKPPLFYWLTAASLQVFGTGNAPARFAPLLAATFGAFALYRLDYDTGGFIRRSLAFE